MKLIHIENKSFTSLPVGNENSWEKLYAIALCELGGNMENLKHVFNDLPQIFPSLPILCLPPICCHIVSIIYVLQNDYTFCSAHLHWPKPTLRTNWSFLYFVLKKKKRALIQLLWHMKELAPTMTPTLLLSLLSWIWGRMLLHFRHAWLRAGKDGSHGANMSWLTILDSCHGSCSGGY